MGAAAANLAVLGGVLLWQGRPASETLTPTTTTPIRSTGSNEGVAPLGGMAESYREQQAAAAAVTSVTMRGGLAESYAEVSAAPSALASSSGSDAAAPPVSAPATPARETRAAAASRSSRP